MRRMVRQLLHVPTVRARELAGEGRTSEYVSALETLYGLELAQPEPAMPQPAQPEASCPAVPETKTA
jgi:glutamyl-tRNA reductase